MLYIFGFFILFYILNGIYYLIGVYFVIRDHKKVCLDNSEPFVSIVVAARNEAKTIQKCLECLIHQVYPTDYYEIIVVNDASTDDTLSIMKRYAKLHAEKIIIVDILPQERQNKGKNNAIDKGIEQSKGEIIITTDADVWMGSNWLASIAHAFDEKTGVIIGIALNKISSNPVHAYQALDSGSINVISVALAAMKYPITCQGSNLAFRRNAYLDVRERVLLLSDSKGNHEWQMQEIDIDTDWEIKPYVHPDSFVYTYPPDSWKTLLNQRTRWASTGKDYSKLSVRIYLTLIYCSLLSLIIALWVLEAKYILLLWVLKLFIDIPVAISVARVMVQPKLIFAFPLVYIIQPFVIVITTLLGYFRLYKWK